MATISRETAMIIAKNQGEFHDDIQAYVVFKFRNKIFDIVNYGLCYSQRDFEQYVNEHEITEILWCRDKLHIFKQN